MRADRRVSCPASADKSDHCNNANNSQISTCVRDVGDIGKFCIRLGNTMKTFTRLITFLICSLGVALPALALSDSWSAAGDLKVVRPDRP